MGSRLQLHADLRLLLGSANVYFQPPESVLIKYPAIIYQKEAGDIKFADNYSYFYKTRYKVTVIDYDPDVPWDVRFLAKFKNQIFVENEYTSKNLNHWVFRLYY